MRTIISFFKKDFCGFEEIGFWKTSTCCGEYLRNRVITFRNSEDYILFLDYLANSSYLLGCKKERCLVCNKWVGGSVRQTPDKKFIFPSWYSHYIECHHLMPEDKAIKLARKWFKKNVKV